MESIIRDMIIKHMKSNKLYSARQYGFISGRSTVLQLLTVIDKWYEILDEGGCIDVINCDFMEAFDKVPHRRLLKNLESYGISGNVLEWVTSFLSNRKQRVRVNSDQSKWVDVISGIPQGSVLGPLLFVTYINDLPEKAKTEIFLFADDMKMFKAIYSKDDCKLLQEDINCAYSWTDSSLLVFHPAKCKQMRIGTSTIDDFTYTMGPQQVVFEKSVAEKDVGVIID